jgi:predicted nucleotidyltransferase
MTNIVQELEKKGLIHPPSWLSCNTMYLTIMGSHAYGINEEGSDFDIYGFSIPPKNQVFPYSDKIYGFESVSVFEQFQKHHIIHERKEYDLSIFSIVKYFKLCMDSNPNMIDSLFVPHNCVIHSTSISELVRNSRRIFLCKEIWAKFKGYAFSTLTKMANKNHEKVKPVIDFESNHGIDRRTTFEDLENEMKKRNIIP